MNCVPLIKHQGTYSITQGTLRGIYLLILYDHLNQSSVSFCCTSIYSRLVGGAAPVLLPPFVAGYLLQHRVLHRVLLLTRRPTDTLVDSDAKSSTENIKMEIDKVDNVENVKRRSYAQSRSSSSNENPTANMMGLQVAGKNIPPFHNFI